MARPTKQESEDRVARILDAAATRFAASGYDTTTVAEIAADCGIRAPSVLHYFQTKEALFLEVLRDRVHRRFLEEFSLDDVDFSQPPEDILASAVRSGMDVWRREPRLIAAAFAELIRPGGIGKDLMHALLLPLIAQFEAMAGRVLPPAGAGAIPIREIALMFVFSLAGRFATLGDDPNLWGPESQVFEALDLIYGAVVGGGSWG